MPKIDPETNEPLSDDPNQEDASLRGGKTDGDPDLDDAKSTGGDGPLER